MIIKEEKPDYNNSIMRFIAFLIIIVTVACTKEPNPEQSICFNENYPPRSNEKVTIGQGLWGDVWFWKGDFMPFNFGTICQVKRTIFIYELTEIKDAVQAEPYSSFYSTINAKLVATIESDSTGFFQIELEPGDYSIFVKEKQFLYSNLFGGQGAIFPVHIESGQVSEIRFDINYEATY